MTKTIRFDKIVVPTDFSDLATGALVVAEQIARLTDGELEVIYVDPFLPPPHFTSSQVSGVAEALSNSKALAADELERYAREHLTPGTRSRTVVLESLPVTGIVDWARRNEANLIVMGTHGRSGISRVMLGSVTERVLRECTVPLMTVRSADPTPHPIRTILCPVNFTGAAQKALDHAAELARLLSAKLIVTHVADKNADESREIGSIDGCLVGFGADAPPVERVILRGNADEAVLRYAETNGVDLIVLAATHRRFFDTTVLGSTTVHVIRHSTVPVLTITSRPDTPG